ncbi:MAG: DUF58 domain-containing protein [Betaproteobacteria bacterium]|nr:DUF58 domain-containing protein [Betaproteobacteria bacterium]
MIGALLERNPKFANWLYGFTPPERGTVLLVHRRVYIVPAQLGWFFVLTLFILLIGSINYALSLGFALTFLLGGLALAGMVHTARNLARMAVSAGRAEPVFAGETAQFRLYLEARAGFDRPSILVRHVRSGAQMVLDVPAAGLAEVVLGVPAERRGWLPLGRVMLETRFPLGIFRAWSYLEPDARCLVYPRPERSALPAPSAESAKGTLRSPTPGNDDYAGLRAYQLSDSPRHVAWKAVARSEDMLTKQFTGEAAAELWLEWALLPAALDAETRLSRLTGWVLEAERSGVHYGLRLPGAEIAPARGEAHRAACLQALALHGVADA